MNEALSQFLEFLRELPPSRKISMTLVLVIVVAGFAFMFIWANQVDYQVLFNNLSREDAGAIVSKLRENNVPHRIEGNGTTILVSADKVHELRLDLAGEGLPNGGHVGFEIFDNTDFRTTRFVQELNYRRALQGELARTINQFKEVKDSKVFIVLPKESLFIEDSKPASASIQLDLMSGLQPGKLAAIVHLVASAVEGLDPEHVTVVDTKGRVVFKGGTRDEATALLSDSQLEYGRKLESEIRKNVQSMLEGIVGEGRAIVRINAEIDFNKITLSEEEYDPSTTAVRSQRDILESSETGENSPNTEETLLNERRGVVSDTAGKQASKTKKDVATNYEINKITRTILRPAGSIKRLSVAAVIDGTYEIEKQEDGSRKKKYIPRSEDELRKFEDIVKMAMGYNEDREDQVTVSSMPFSDSLSFDAIPAVEPGFDALRFVETYKKTLINLFLVTMVFFLIVRPLLKSMKKVGEERALARRELQESTEELAQLTEENERSQKERVLDITKNNPAKTEQLIKGWIGES